MNNPNVRQFVYRERLQGRSIRLLRIDRVETCKCGFPTNSNESQPCIHSSLETVDLNDNPLYDCLSYTWGEPLYQGFLGGELQPREKNEYTPHQPHIVCDGHIFLAQKNLFDVLKQLWKNKVNSSDGEKHDYRRQDRIWIDAICMNQKDEEEKSIQINMMTEIYSRSSNVIVWLGPDCCTGPDSPPILAIGLNVLNVLASVPKEKHGIVLPYNLGSPLLYKLLGINPPIPKRDWDAFAEFILRNWFQRMWVVQETWAARNVVVLCGDNVVMWNKITAAIQTLIATKLDQLLNVEVIKTVEGFGTETRYIGNPISNQFIFQESREHKKNLNLERLLAYSRFFNATIPEDKIFAIRGMWTPRKNLVGLDVSTLLPPSKEGGTVKHVYANATQVAMQEMENINILSLVEHINTQSEHSNLIEKIDYLTRPGVESSRISVELPSWVPNYSVQPMLEPLNNVPRTLKEKGRWKASGKLKWEPHQKSKDKTILTVQGFCQDEILERGATDIEIIQDHSMYTVLELLENALDSTPSRPSMEQFWRALIKDTFRSKAVGDEARRRFLYLILDPLRELQIALAELRDEEEKVDSLKIAHLQAILSKTEGLIADLSTREGSTMASLEEMQNIIDNAENLPAEVPADWTEIWRCFRSAYMGRRMFRTRSNYLGISAQTLLDGDEIWILAGADVPMVLRKTEERGKRKFVGEAYIYGMMEGEMVESATYSRLTNIILE